MSTVPSISKILSVAAGEVRTSRRQVRFWTIVFLLSLFSLAGYGLSCSFLAYAATTSPSYGTGIPQYLLGNIDPSFFLMFQMAALFLLFDTSHQQKRDRIAEVLDSKPISNFEYLAGRVLGIAALLWIVAVLNILAMQVFGWVATTTNIAVGDTLQLHSVLNLIFLDAPTTLLFWCSVVVLLASALRMRVVVAAVGVGLMFAWFTLVLESPYSLQAIVSPSSNDSLFVSELLPELASPSVLAIRAGTVLAALALLAIATVILPRRDGHGQMNSVISTTAGGLGAVLATLGSWSHVAHVNGADQWAEAHQNFEWNATTDLTSITGMVQMERSRLAIDLILNVECQESKSNELVFSFNPAMNIQTLEMNGNAVQFSFQNGLLVIENPSAPAEPRAHTLHIVAHGVPDQRFAYLNSAFDYLSVPKVPRQAIALFGSHASIYDSRYVALMPATHWYPVPGPIQQGYSSLQHGLDYFDVDLTVALENDDWQLVGPTASIQLSEPANAYRVTSEQPIHEIGLFASNFESASIDIEGTRFFVYLHKRHASNLRLVEEIEVTVRERAGTWLSKFSEHGLTIPNRSVSFVEVPRRLRMVGGGWRMDSKQTLPGLVLLNERGFPNARLDLVRKRQSDSETSLSLGLFEWLVHYSQQGIGPDDVLSDLAAKLLTDSTSATGQYAQPLETILQFLTTFVGRDDLDEFSNSFFNAYSTIHFADTTAISLFEGVTGIEDGVSNSQVPSSMPTLRRVRQRYSTRTSIWNDLEIVGFPNLPTGHGHKRDLEFSLFKCREIARALFSINGEDLVLNWLADVLHQKQGGNFTYVDLIRIAEQHEVVIDPFLTHWLSSASLPGFAASPYTTFRIQDDERGNPQFQTSVAVRNTSNVAGSVRLQYPTEETWNWIHPYVESSKAVRIEGNSTKQINLLTAYEIRSVYLNPGLSLNRDVLGLIRDPSSPNELTNREPASYETIGSWSPPFEEGIIVDDLDPGFVVQQKAPRTTRPSRVGPRAWFRMPRLDVEMDHGLPVRGRWMFEWHPPRGMWTRVSEPRAYGEYRRTAALFWSRGHNPQAAFVTEIPESTRWRLDYHAPQSLSDSWYRGLKYELVVTSDTESWNVELDAHNWNIGWNVVDEFDLNEGAARVDLVGVSQHSLLIADAVRWTKITGQ
ncbi:MAG: hypothetical protein OXG08_05330 [Gammaproteobacteria bacterium]|nr:hypothetical protein [Gammaproteobacteria bacterium]